MYVFLTVLAIVICLMLILIVLIQEPKGGGLSSSFGASNQIMGVKKTGDFLEQATWGLALALLVICLGMKVFSPSSSREESAVQQQAEKSAVPAQIPSTPIGPAGASRPSGTTRPSGVSPAPAPSSPAAVPVSPSAAPQRSKTPAR